MADTKELLSNPCWYAMNTLQSGISTGSGGYRRYLPDISPFAALETPDALGELNEQVLPGEIVALFSPCSPYETGSDWDPVQEVHIIQMICESPLPYAKDYPGHLLGEEDDQDMLALAAETDPGPFMIHTGRMGDYLGVRDESGALVAMAGERMRLTGWTEISGVCTAASARGKGYASGLCAQLQSGIQARGENAFLHVRIGSESEAEATAVYRKLGFSIHQRVLVQIVRRI